MLIIQIPTGSRDHEIIVLIVTCVLLTFLAFSVAKCVRKRITEMSCASRKQPDSTNAAGDDDEGEQEAAQTETNNLNPKS